MNATHHIYLTDAVLIGHLPSKKSRCPRLNCGAEMLSVSCEHMIVTSCPTGHYEVRDSSSGQRADYAKAVRGNR